MQISDAAIVAADSAGAISAWGNAGAASIEMSHPFSIPDAASPDTLAIPVVDDAAPTSSNVGPTPHTPATASPEADIELTAARMQDATPLTPVPPHPIHHKFHLLTANCVGKHVPSAGAAIVALFVYGCTATVYMYGTPTTLGIWLGVFLPCGLCCGLIGFGLQNADENSYWSNAAFICGALWWLSLLIGIVAGVYWLALWWLMTHNGTLREVDAAAMDWIGNKTAPDFGIYYFTATAFVNQAQFGWATSDGTVISSAKHYCIAPVVSAAAQMQVLFWAAAEGCCDASGVWCWSNFATPGAVTGAYPYVRYASTVANEMLTARLTACDKLSFNSSVTGSQLCSLPAVYLNIDSDPERVARAALTNGMAFAGVMAVLWPFAIALIFGLFYLLGANK